MENWRKIPNFSRYEASESGTLRSLNYKRTGRTKELKPARSNDGYLKTILLDDSGKYNSITVHLMVATTFLGSKPIGLEINHKNGIKTDNSVANLEYVTHSDNVQHSFDMGLQLPKRGELNGMAKLTREQVEEIREIAKNGGRYWGRNVLASKYGVSAKHLQDIVNNDTLWR